MSAEWERERGTAREWPGKACAGDGGIWEAKEQDTKGVGGREMR